MASGRSLELTGPAVPFVQRILREGEFAVSDCQRWDVDGEPFAYANVVALLTELRREGLVDVVPASAPSRAQ
jgi:hypothetical protein